MTKRQVGQDFIGFRLANVARRATHLSEYVTLRQHRSLGSPRRSRRVDQDGEIVGTQQLNARTTGLSVGDIVRLRGRMTLADLAGYEISVREPVRDNYRGFEIVSMPPPSSGGLTVIQILKLIERFPIGDESQGFGFGSTRTLNVMMEAMRLAFADRAVWMGDTDFVPNLPVNGLIDDDYIATRTVLIDSDSRQANVEAGDPRPFDMAEVDQAVKIAMGLGLDSEGVNTTHFSIVRHCQHPGLPLVVVRALWEVSLPRGPLSVRREGRPPLTHCSLALEREMPTRGEHL